MGCIEYLFKCEGVWDGFIVSYNYLLPSTQDMFGLENPMISFDAISTIVGTLLLVEHY